MIILNYKDNGPVGVCGQDTSITSSWNQLVIVDNAEEAEELAKEVSKIESRKNPRIEHYWDDFFKEDIIDKRKEGQ